MKRLLSLPAAVYILALWIGPGVGLLAMSFRRRNIYGGFDAGWSINGWLNILHWDTARVLVRTIGLTFLSTVFCLVLAYFAASLATRLPNHIQYVIMAMFAVPIGVDTLIKVFGWSALIGPNGFAGSLFQWMEVESLEGIAASVKLLSVCVLLYLPLAVLPVWVDVRQIDLTLYRAARDAGANALKTFAWIVLPLSRRGMTSAVLLIWVSCLTNFLIPDLVGGAKKYYLGNLIKQQFFEARNWPSGAALGVIAFGLSLLGVALVLGAINLQDRLMLGGRKHLQNGERPLP
jgi:spermidine/putrescine transport system permease protein